MQFIKFLVLVFISFLYTNTISSQSVSGFVTDAIDKKPIPFANLIIKGTTTGTSTDIDGYFNFTPNSFPFQLNVRVLGYHDTTITIAGPQHLQLKLREKTFELQAAIIYAGENPAIPIIKKAIKNRKLNNPEKNFTFTYNTYSKMVFGPEISTKTELVLTDSSTAVDSSNHAFQQSMKKHYLFVTETVTERKFIPPDKSYEKVIANRVSGLKNPTFTLIASEFQPFSFSTDYVTIVGLSYLSPLARNSYKNYVFELKDSILVGSDTIYVLRFQPKKGSTFYGLKGTMSINTNKYAVQNIQFTQANPGSSFEIAFEQLSEFIDGKQWFPVQFNSHIIFKMDNSSSNQDFAVELINARGRTYIKDIVIDADISKKEIKNVALELSSNANKKDSAYWDSNRKQPLTEKEQNTYMVIDSIGEKFKLDQKMKVLEAITTGFIPLGPVSIPINSLIDYSDYEGIRLGLGLRTNDKVSKYVSVGGYGAYGFNDEEWKFGADLKFDISRKNDVFAGVKYERDISASGDIEFYKTSPFDIRSYNKIYLSRMDKQEGYHAYFSFRALRDFQNQLFYNYYSQSYNYDYTYSPNGDTLLSPRQTFNRSEIGWSFRFGFKEKYIRTFGKNISLGTKFPYVWMRLAHSNESIGSAFTYTKVDVKITKTFKIKGIGDLGFQIEAGTTTGNVPSSLLHYGHGMRISGFNLYIQNSFNTMAPNEFLSQQYASIHIHNNFGALYKAKLSAPEISVITSAGWGNLPNPEWHTGIAFSTMEKGFFESGILLDKLLILNTSGLGAGVFYRYGPYAFDNLSDNFGFSLTFISVFQ